MFQPKGEHKAYNSNQSSQPFNYVPQFFSQCINHDLDYPILQLQVSLNVCAHIPSTLWVFTFYITFMAMSAQEFMMQFVTVLLPLDEMLVSTWDENNYMRFLQPHSTPFVNGLILCSPKMTFTPQLTLSLSTQCKHIYFLNLAQLKNQVPPMWLEPKKGAIVTNTPFTNSSHQQLRYLDVYTNKPVCFYMIVPMPFGASKGQRALIFLSWLLFFVKKSQSHYKGCKHLPS